MSLVWVVPFVVLLIGIAAAVALARATVESARELGQEIARFGELHGALARVRSEIQQTSVHMREIKGRSPHR